MKRLDEIAEQIKMLKKAKSFLEERYSESEFHKKKEKHPHSAVPPSPEDEEIYKLLNAIQQLDKYVKELQDEQFMLLKAQEER
jgi:prefoldin subunit 5